jgi:N-acetylneuraminate lyase
MKTSARIIAAAFTPMDEAGELQLEKIDDLARLYRKNEVDGVFIAGTTGECSALTFEEKKQLMEQWAVIDQPGLQKIYMLGGTSLKDIQYLASMAVDCGMDAVSIVCPYYLKPQKVQDLVDFCRLGVAHIPEMPFFYYHIPQLSGGHFSMSTFLALAAESIPNLAGIKYSAPNIMEFHACCAYQEGRYEMYWGSDEALLSGLVVGAAGAIGSTYNYAAPLYRKIIQAIEQGRLAEAEKWQRRAVEMVSLLFKYGGGGAGKTFMKIIGLDCGRFRPPVTNPSDEQRQALERELRSIGFFEFCNKL